MWRRPLTTSTCGEEGVVTTVSRPALTVRGLSKRFGGVAALSDVALDVHRGEVVALAGENGAGKSTLVNVLSGMYRPDAGTIHLDGRPVRIDSPARARSLGIATVFQDLALCDNLDVVRNLFLGQEIGSLSMDDVAMERQAKQLLRQVFSTVTRVRTRVGELSGGQRQTVAIARSLLGDPSIVILDEPTAALGSTQRSEVLYQIEQLRARGLGVIMISHNLDDIGAVADRVAVLRHGRNNGVFDVRSTTSDRVHEAMTGTTPGGGFLRSENTGRHQAQRMT
jgi:simple sugar transport system ATP-binding protein/D-xylose transport system ATP-binding protein